MSRAHLSDGNEVMEKPEKLFDDGPRWEFGEVTEDGKIPVRVWLEWRDVELA